MKRFSMIIILAFVFMAAGESGLWAGSWNLDFSTYLGGSDYEALYGLSVESGKVYVAGDIVSLDFPTANAYQSAYGGGHSDAFVSALSSGGSSLVFSTYLGGSSEDAAKGISVESGKVCVTGFTQSSDFPTTNAYQASCGGTFDAFVSALSSTGSSLLFSTYLGGSSDDSPSGISVASGEVYVTGVTRSSDFPTLNAYQASLGGTYNAFVSTLSSTGSSLVFSTYLGGSDYDKGLGISVASGKVYVTGVTRSSDFPTANAYQSAHSGGTFDVFVSALSYGGSSLFFSTYLGGSDHEKGFGISVASGEVYVVGDTDSLDFPTANAYQASCGGNSDAFVSALSSGGSSLLFSTYLGGSSEDGAFGISVESGEVYVAGDTDSLDFPTANAYQASCGGAYDAFVSALSSGGSSLLFSTYLGGSEYDGSYNISVESGEVYVAGGTQSLDFPTANAYQAAHGGGTFDVFVSALLYIPTLSPTPSPTPSVTPTPSPTPSVTPTSTATPSSTPTAAPSLTPTPSLTPVPTASPAATPTVTPTPSGPDYYVIESGDYNGDGTSDIAYFRPSSGLWAVMEITRVYLAGDIPASGDYDGDGTTDIGVFRKDSGLWAIRGVTRAYFGSSDDRVVPGDYDGDGCCDVGIFREGSGLWALRGKTRTYFGGSNDRPVPGDIDGDGTQDIGIFRGGSGLWALRNISRVYFGSSGDEAVPGDYDGDVTWEVGIFRPSSGLWAIRGITRSYFGSASDQPVLADFDGDWIDDIGIFRDTSGLWAVRGVTRVYFGASGDIPVSR